GTPSGPASHNNPCCKPTTHRLVWNVIQPTTHRFGKGRREPTVLADELSVRADFSRLNLFPAVDLSGRSSAARRAGTLGKSRLFQQNHGSSLARLSLRQEHRPATALNDALSARGDRYEAMRCRSETTNAKRCAVGNSLTMR